MERVSIIVDAETAEKLRVIARAESLRPRGPGPLAATVRLLASRWTPPEVPPAGPVRA